MQKKENRFRELSKTVLIFCLGIVFFGGVFAKWSDIKEAGNILTAQDWNDLVANIGNGFFTDGVATDDLDMNHHKIANLAAPINAKDATNKGYVDAQVGTSGGGGGVACTVICNGTCPVAPEGWSLSRSTGRSGKGGAAYAAGRCYTPEGNKETMCCYFMDNSSLPSIDTDGDGA